MGLGLMVTALLVGSKSKLETLPKASGKERWDAFKDAFWGLLMPVIILGGIYGGIFTPTEAAAVSVIYGLFVGIFIYKQIRVQELYTLLLVNIILLIAGCFLDSTSALYIFTPLFVPVANALGIDLVHLGVVMIVNLAIGLFTPPVGVNLYVACGVADVNLKEISRAVVPLLIASIIVLLIVTYVPAVSLAFV